VGSSDITRSKPQSDTTTTQSISSATASRLRRARSRSSSGGTASRRSVATKSMATRKSAPVPSHVRSQKKPQVSHGCFAGIGVVSHG